MFIDDDKLKNFHRKFNESCIIMFCCCHMASPYHIHCRCDFSTMSTAMDAWSSLAYHVWDISDVGN